MKNSVRFFRTQKRLSQKDLGALVHLSDKTVSNYELSEDAPEDFLRNCARVLEVSYDEISRTPPDTLNEAAPEPEGSGIPLQAFTREQLESLLKSMTGELELSEGPRKKLLYFTISNIAGELNRRLDT